LPDKALAPLPEWREGGREGEESSNPFFFFFRRGKRGRRGGPAGAFEFVCSRLARAGGKRKKSDPLTEGTYFLLPREGRIDAKFSSLRPFPKGGEREKKRGGK